MDGLSYQPLTPTAFLERSALVHADRLAVVDGDKRFSYREFRERVGRLAGAVAALGTSHGGRVAVLAPNTHVLLEAHYGVPLAGAALVALNVRLAPEELAYIVEHSGATVLICDWELRDTGKAVAELLAGRVRLVEAGGPDDAYEALLAEAASFALPVQDERSLLSINYTSGTTGRPKGVMYHHRGAYLQSLAMAFHMGLDSGSVYLWTLPMFHCNGWCFPWGVSAAGAVHLCLRKIDPTEIWRLIGEEGVTHFNAAPTVLSMLAEHSEAGGGSTQRIHVGTGGAPPSPTLLARMSELNVAVTHLYGLTETFGPSVVCEWKPEWDGLPLEEQAALKARQGVGNVISERVRVLSPKGEDVPADGETMGEVVLRGNNVMLGYYRDPEATRAAAPDGWFRTGDLGVSHPDGYVELKDRGKDVIISGGENIASIEVEQAIESHPAVLEAAVVAKPHGKWGEVPVAFVALREGAEASESEIVEHVQGRLARFKAPKEVRFGLLPKTSTGKVQKYLLRDQVSG